MASRFDRRDPGQDEAYTNGLGRVTTGRHDDVDDVVSCAYCGDDTPAPPVRSSHPMCSRCARRQLSGLSAAPTTDFSLDSPVDSGRAKAAGA